MKRHSRDANEGAMTRADSYGLRDFIGVESIDREQQKLRFERTQKAMADWRSGGGKGALGDFYEWLLSAEEAPLPTSQCE